MELSRYIQHPELLNRDTLYELRCYVALHPYNQAARFLMLHNLYLLHDPTFNEELRNASFYITDRNVLFNLVEAKHYKYNKEEKTTPQPVADTTQSLIDTFLDTIEEDDEPEPKRKPTIADATIDYMAYLLAKEDDHDEPEPTLQPERHTTGTTSAIIDNFLQSEGGRFTLATKPDDTATQAPHDSVTLENDKDELEEDYYTETLAKIYIKQANYSKALEIITQLNLNNSKKNVYFAHQMRYLEKLIKATAHD